MSNHSRVATGTDQRDLWHRAPEALVLGTLKIYEWSWGVVMGRGHGTMSWGVVMGHGHGTWSWGVVMGHGHGHGAWSWDMVMWRGHGAWSWDVVTGGALAGRRKTIKTRKWT
ncbi:uncharacterized [Tachysurus ichikawai]